MPGRRTRDALHHARPVNLVFGARCAETWTNLRSNPKNGRTFTAQSPMRALDVGYRVRDEVAGIAALRRRAATLGSEALHQIAWTREVVLAERLHDALESVPTRWRPNIGKRDRLGLRALATGVEQVTVILQQATRQLRAQFESAPLTAGQREGRMRELAERLAHVEAALAVAERAPKPIKWMRRFSVVGEAGLVAPSTLKPFVEGGAKSRRAMQKQVWLWLSTARRFPPSGRDKAPPAADCQQPLVRWVLAYR